MRIAAPFVAEVQMIEGGAKIQLDQDFLETVIPVFSILTTKYLIFRLLETKSKY